MNLSPAPFHADLSEGPINSKAWWITTKDKLQLRIAHFPSDQTNGTLARGTVLLFPGRTEYVEKYGRVGMDFAALGYDVLAIDWRGQGLADRMLDEPLTGHVNMFEDYQTDVAAMVEAANKLNLPRPWHLLGHSMGGCIGLRSVYDGLPVESCAFTGPMWGIGMSESLRPAAWVVSWGSSRVGLGHMYTPGTKHDSYVASAPFDDNMLTTDPDGWDYMRRQVLAVPELQLAGPSLQWLHEALVETRDLYRKDSPNMPCLTFLGTNERIVDVPRIYDRMRRWPNSQLVKIYKGEHEVLMESPETRKDIISQLAAHFDRASHTPALSA